VDSFVAGKGEIQNSSPHVKGVGGDEKGEIFPGNLVLTENRGLLRANV
jgi:hypothetical protein